MRDEKKSNKLKMKSIAFVLSEGKITRKNLNISKLLNAAGVEAQETNVNFPNHFFQRAINFVYENLRKEYQDIPFSTANDFLGSLTPHKKSMMEILLMEYSEEYDEFLGSVLVTISRNLRHFKTINYASSYYHESLKSTCYHLKHAFSRAFSIQRPHVYIEVTYFIVNTNFRRNNFLRVGEKIIKNLTRFKNGLSLELHEKIVIFGAMRKELTELTLSRPIYKRLPKMHAFEYPGDNHKSVFVVTTI